MGDLFVVRGSVRRTKPVRVVFTVTISSNRSYLDPDRNHNAAYADKIAKSKLQLVCTRPPPSSMLPQTTILGSTCSKRFKRGLPCLKR